MDQQPPAAPPPPAPPTGEGLPPTPGPGLTAPDLYRAPLPKWQIALWVLLLALIILIARPGGELSSYQIGRWLGGIALPLMVGAGIWALAGRRGGRRADMRSPALLAIALPVALIGALGRAAGDTPTTAELADRFVAVPGLTYRPLTAAEQADLDTQLGSFRAPSLQARWLQGPDGADEAMVVALGFDPDEMGSDEDEFMEGVARGFESPSGAPAREVAVDGVSALIGEVQGISALILPDTEDGVVLYVYGEEKRALDIGERLVATF